MTLSRRAGRIKWPGLAIVVGLFLGLGLIYQSRHLFFLRDFKGVVQSLTVLSQQDGTGIHYPD